MDWLESRLFRRGFLSMPNYLGLGFVFILCQKALKLNSTEASRYLLNCYKAVKLRVAKQPK
jgi:hypothetical protein